MQHSEGRVLRAGLDDEAGIDMLPSAWLNIYPAPADKVDLEEYTGGVGPVLMDDIWPQDQQPPSLALLSPIHN